MVIDNGSSDDSVQAIRSAYPDIPIIETKANLGFAGGNNVGIRWALEKSFEWILLLNNDTIVAPDLIRNFIQAARQKPSGKIFGAKIYRYNDRSRIDHLGGFWDPAHAEFISFASGQIDDGSFDEMKRVDYVCGAALFMHRSVPETIGLLEESFFLLWEESDFCARARRAGFEIWTAPHAKIWHKVSASFTGGKPHMQYFWWRNRLLWIRRNCRPAEKRKLYRQVIVPEMGKNLKFVFFKTAQAALAKLLNRSAENELCSQKAQRFRAGCRGIWHYFTGRFGNCPLAYQGSKNRVRKVP
jgi:GT2 family glycosyltransferase